MKAEIRVLGIDDAPFEFKSKNVLIVGAFFRGGKSMDGLISTTVKKDGKNATRRIAEMVNNSKFRPQIQAILLDGIAVGGFNVIDIGKLNKILGIPVIVIMREYPDRKKMFDALRKIGQSGKIRLIEKAGDIRKINEKIYIQFSGIDFHDAKKIVELTTTNAEIPEPLRIAHIIASGIIKGESYGRA